MDKEKLLSMYERMCLIRAFEEACIQLYTEKEIRGSLHPCVGQEATAVGSCFALNRDDYLTCTYRGHGACIAKGVDVNAAMAEMLSRRTGISKGKGGSMHWTDPSIGLLGENGIVAAGVPIAAGAAFSSQLDDNKRVALTIFGDGAINQGVFHETLNIAQLWKLFHQTHKARFGFSNPGERRQSASTINTASGRLGSSCAKPSARA